MKFLGNKTLLFFVSILYLNTFINGYDIIDEVRYNEEVCHEKVDIYLLLDGSGSIGYFNWVTYAVPLVNDLVSNLSISEEGIHLYLSVFSHVLMEYIPLHGVPSYTKELALGIVKELKNKYTDGGSTNLTLALNQVLVKNFINPNRREDAVQLVVIFTDGAPNNKWTALDEMRKLKYRGVKFAVIGIGRGINSVYNRTLVGCHPHEYECPLYSEASWEGAKDIISPFLKSVCIEVEKVAACGTWGEWSPCSVTCGKGIRTRRRTALHEKCTDHMTDYCELPDCPAIVEPGYTPVDTPEEQGPYTPQERKEEPKVPEPFIPEPVAPEKSTKPKESLTPEKPIKPEESFTPEKPIKPEDSLTPEKPTKPEESLTPEKPTKPEESLTPEKLTKPEESLTPEKPIKPEESLTPKKPIKTEELIVPISEKYEEKRKSEEIENSLAPEILPETYPNNEETHDNITPTFHKEKRESREEDYHHYATPKEYIEYVNKEHKPINEVIDEQKERNTKPHKESYEYIPPKRDHQNVIHPHIEEVESEQSEENRKKGSNDNKYKIAGGVLGGLALLGCAGFAYKFLSTTGAAAMAPGGDAPFDDVLAEGEKDIEENEQFKLPEDNDWN